jgi:phosphoglycerol transferase MdoB-like AlkP superfamily enzyme
VPDLTRWRRRVDPYLPGLAGTAIVAVLCNLVLEVSRLSGAQRYPWQYKTPWFVLLFLLGSVVIWMLVGLVHAVVGRLSVTIALAATATALVAVIDHLKVRFRREPLYPSDWQFVGNLDFLTQMIGIRMALLVALGVAALAVLTWLGARALRRRLAVTDPPVRDPRRRGSRLGVRVLTAATCALGLVYVGGFNSSGNLARGAYEAFGAQWRPWSQQRNYLGNGFVGGYLYNLDPPEMPRPEGYSAAAMSRIVDTYRRAAAQTNRSRSAGSLDDVNVVSVLSESFTDPTALSGVHLDRDPIPFTRRLMRQTTSGEMLAQNVGGGTANMEFETLTGMSMSQFPPQVRVPYQMVIPEHDSFPSAVEYFKQHGHRAIAMHPFTTEMYRRRDVYRILGFDEFLHQDTMQHRRRIGDDGYVSDAAAFNELTDLIAAEDDPLFVNLVTMQNHIPYADKYDDPVAVTGPDGEDLPEVGQYVRGLSHTDEALRDLIGDLRRSDERTIVVFYGDHLPPTYPDTVFQRNGRRAMHETPYFVWANFAGPTVRAPMVSPIHFLDLVLEHADAPVPPYYELLRRLRRQVPAMGGGMMVDADGDAVRPDRLSDEATKVLHDYRLVQYDLAAGKRYSERAMFGLPGG